MVQGIYRERGSRLSLLPKATQRKRQSVGLFFILFFLWEKMFAENSAEVKKSKS